MLILQSINARQMPHPEVQTDAVLGLDEDALLTTDEVTKTFLKTSKK